MLGDRTGIALDEGVVLEGARVLLRHALELLGETNDAIAGIRGRSSSTVANQIAAIFDKLGVASRCELAIALSS